MSNPSFSSALRAFSGALEKIPQDNIPTGLIHETDDILDSMLQYSVSKGQSPLTGLSNLSIAVYLELKQKWYEQNPVKALVLDTVVTAEDENSEFLVPNVCDYADECDRFVASQMADFLTTLKEEVPYDLRAFLEIGKGGSKEIK